MNALKNLKTPCVVVFKRSSLLGVGNGKYRWRGLVSVQSDFLIIDGFRVARFPVRVGLSCLVVALSVYFVGKSGLWGVPLVLWLMEYVFLIKSRIRVPWTDVWTVDYDPNINRYAVAFDNFPGMSPVVFIAPQSMELHCDKHDTERSESQNAIHQVYNSGRQEYSTSSGLALSSFEALEPAEKLLNQAIHAEDNGSSDKAIQLYEETMRNYPRTKAARHSEIYLDRLMRKRNVQQGVPAPVGDALRHELCKLKSNLLDLLTGDYDVMFHLINLEEANHPEANEIEHYQRAIDRLLRDRHN